MGWPLGKPNYAKRTPPEVRFESKIYRTEGHWLWVGACKPTGYGMFFFRNDANFIAHRASYIMHCGEIPPHLVVDHICKVKSCVNPEHLRLVRQVDNCTILAAPTPFTTNSGKTHCKYGHPFKGDNIAWHKPARDRWPSRVCVACRPWILNSKYLIRVGE